MKKKILTGLLLLTGTFTGLNANAQDTSLLYKITGPGLSRPSYLYGTFHLVCPADLTITEPTKKALDSARQVYLELDMDDPALMSGMMKAMMMTDGKTLKALLKPDDYAVLDGYLKQKMNLSLGMLNTMKPIGLLSLLYTGVLNCQPVSYDLTFAQMAAQQKKEVLGLESLEAEMAALDKIPLDVQLKSLVEMARNPEAASKEFTDFVAAYNTHDIRKLTALMKASHFDMGAIEYENALLSERNANWVPVIEKAAKEKPTFFAFGAGHLGTDTGVINRLRRKGYTVTAVKEGEEREKISVKN